MFDELGIDYAYGKLREKMNRIKVLRNKPNMVENEGLEDALLDTAGYAILTLVELKKRKDNDDFQCPNCNEIYRTINFFNNMLKDYMPTIQEIEKYIVQSELKMKNCETHLNYLIEKTKQ